MMMMILSKNIGLCVHILVLSSGVLAFEENLKGYDPTRL
jgi:hypothetical protein